VLVEPVPVDVLDSGGRTVRVDARLAMSAPPALVRWSGSGAPGAPVLPGIGAGAHRLVAWAGPWPMVERWWSPEVRRRVHLQVALEGGRALLLSCSQGVWVCEAVYD
jgi:protein ImuB